MRVVNLLNNNVNAKVPTCRDSDKIGKMRRNGSSIALIASGTKKFYAVKQKPRLSPGHYIKHRTKKLSQRKIYTSMKTHVTQIIITIFVIRYIVIVCAQI